MTVLPEKKQLRPAVMDEEAVCSKRKVVAHCDLLVLVVFESFKLDARHGAPDGYVVGQVLMYESVRVINR
jgi:hypothetical protein